ncbi:MAG: hypothetical protein V5A27_03135 [Halapricum sp.]
MAHTVYRIAKDSSEEMGLDPETGDGIGGDPSDESPGVKTDV